MHRLCAASLFLLAVSSVAWARVGTVFDGNAQFQWANTSGSSATLGNVNIRPDGGFGTPDYSFQLWWWFRAEGVVPREFGFPDADFAGETYVGNTAVVNWTNIGVSGGRFTARLETRIADGSAPGQMTVEQTMIITSTNATTFSLTLFAYNDLDAGGSSFNDSAMLADPATTRIRITDGPDFVDWRPSAGASFAVAQGATSGGFQLRNQLNDTGLTNLMNTGLPWVSNDFAGAFQWTITLNPGETKSVSHTISMNISLAPPPCLGDANNDRMVNFADITAALAGFGGPGPAGDADYNGSVNFGDITTILAQWSQACQ